MQQIDRYYKVLELKLHMKHKKVCLFPHVFLFQKKGQLRNLIRVVSRIEDSFILFEGRNSNS